MKRSIAGRVVVAGLLFLVLGAPASGYVGSCGTEDTSADPEAFCRERRTWVCARLRYAADACAGAMPFTQAEYEACVARIPTDCAGARFDASCMPSQSAADGCIAALMEGGNVCVPEAMISECNLCASM